MFSKPFAVRRYPGGRSRNRWIVWQRTPAGKYFPVGHFPSWSAAMALVNAGLRETP